MSNEFRQFAAELQAQTSDEARQEVIETWQSTNNIINKTTDSVPAYITYLDNAVSISVPNLYQGDIDFTSQSFTVDKLKTLAAVFSEAYQYALETQPARDEEKDLKDAVIAAGTDVPLDEESATNLVTELDRLGYEIVKKV